MTALPFIVLIEPDWPARSYFRAELEELGYAVSAHERAADAAHFLAGWGLRPDLIVVDLASDGEQLAELQRMLEDFPDTRLLVLASPLRALPEWLRQRASRILSRPFAVSDVVRVVSELAPLIDR
jgi:CheY-like chemotaxis protein